MRGELLAGVRGGAVFRHAGLPEFCVWLGVKNRGPKWNPGKWKNGVKPAVVWWCNLTHTHLRTCEFMNQAVLWGCQLNIASREHQGSPQDKSRLDKEKSRAEGFGWSIGVLSRGQLPQMGSLRLPQTNQIANRAYRGLDGWTTIGV